MKRPKQSHNALEIKRLPRFLWSLAMTKKDCDTVSIAEAEAHDSLFCLLIDSQLVKIAKDVKNSSTNTIILIVP